MDQQHVLRFHHHVARIHCAPQNANIGTITLVEKHGYLMC